MITGRSARTLRYGIQVVRAVTKRPDVLREPDARLQLGIQQIAFVQEQHKLDVRQKLIAGYGFPEENAVLLW